MSGNGFWMVTKPNNFGIKNTFSRSTNSFFKQIWQGEDLGLKFTFTVLKVSF